MRRSRITQELANGFPDWTKVRNDDQSVGKSFLNVIGLGLEPLFTELERGKKNMFLSSFFVGEIDQTFILDLPESFSFTIDSPNSLVPVVSSPTLSGLVDDTWIAIEEVENGSVKTFWYDANPTRVTELETFSINGFLVASGVSSDNSLTLVNSGLFLDNQLTIVVDGENLIEVNDLNELRRSSIRIIGETWKETIEQEDIVFLFSETKQTRKAWNSIDSIKPIDFVSESTINIYSHKFNLPYYSDSFETLSQRFDTRENLPLFWSIEQSLTGDSILHADMYNVTRAIDLLKFKPTIAEVQNWELVDLAGSSLEVLDIAVLPYQQKMIALDQERILIYDLFFELPDLKLLAPKTPNALIDLEISSDYIIRAEEVEITTLFVRPIKTIVKHRMKLTYPDGAEFGILLDGTLVPTSSDFWIRQEITERFIRTPFFLELDDFGEHIITLECQYLDNTTETVERLVLVQHKQALAEIDISEIISNPVGIDIDHQNNLLILDDSNTVHRLKLHFDKALIDFDSKQIIFREVYDQVKVIK